MKVPGRASGDPDVRVVAARPADAAVIDRVHELAFGGREEAEIVAALAARCDDLVSLVAVPAAGGEVVGHILFSPVEIAVDGKALRGMGLGPMAVLPDRQRRGIGTRLVQTGLARLRAGGCPFVVVVGHPEYYPRFGFEPAVRHRLWCEWEVPDEAFMVLVLEPGIGGRLRGLVRYRPEFGGGSSAGVRSPVVGCR